MNANMKVVGKSLTTSTSGSMLKNQSEKAKVLQQLALSNMDCLCSRNAPKDQEGLMTELAKLHALLARALLLEAGLSHLELGRSSRLPALNELLDECDSGLKRLGAALGNEMESIEATPGREMEGLGKDLGRNDCVQTVTSRLDDVRESTQKLELLIMDIENIIHRVRLRLTLKTNSGVETLQEQGAKHSQMSLVGSRT
ncbi:hypothetical protein JB92DRAFT_3096197 [Gautieria morchelliformis]|nr:hypothetical protein JB92DRAFT_3096197 [Gautieria morchelliformis]